jgi:hypothetical protein
MARKGFGGFDVVNAVNRITGKVALAVNVRAYFSGGFTLRSLLTDAILTVTGAIQTIARLNDSTPAGPAGGFTYIVKDAAGNLYSGTTGTLTASATGLSTNPISIVTFRPNTSVQPWGYIADSAPSPNVNIVADSFLCAGMLKVRSDGKVRKMGIAEPQAAPTVTFPGGGSGPALIYYKYVYRASETGALSNPSPISTPGTNAQSSPTKSEVAATAGVINPNITVNGAQYEGNGAQIRTKGGVGGSTVTDYIIARNFGFTLPANVTIDGVQIDLNWLGQNGGTGSLTGVALYYQGGQVGSVKSPGTQNQSFASDALQGGSGDTWGTGSTGVTLTPAVINDSTFGFGVQITTAVVGGTNRSFINSMAITVFYSTQDAMVTPAASTDPQVDKIDIYRQGGGLADFTYVGTTPNSATAFDDQASDLAVAANPQLQYDNFEPFPSIDLPRSGVLNAASQVLSYVSGDHFNIRWLPGTEIQIGATTQIAYTAVRRPASTTSWNFTGMFASDGSVVNIPDGSNLVWNIAEPALAQQPLPYLFGPTDNINFIFGVGDPLRPGTLYWCKGSNLDSAPDTNQMDVTDPSEPLVNGAMSGGRGVLASIKRFWVIMPNFFNALATATGTSGSTWTLQATSIPRGLFIPRCLAVAGGGNIFFRVDDGVHVSPGGLGSESITDGDLYPLFSHEGSTPAPVVRNGKTIYPPDDSHPERQQFQYVLGYLYYDYYGTDDAYHTLVFDEAAGGWVYDLYSTQVVTHSPNEDESIQGILAGGKDGTLRKMVPAGVEIATGTVITPAIGGKGFMFIQEVTVEYSSNDAVVLSTIAPDANNGSYGANDVILPTTGGVIAKTKFLLSANKGKMFWFQFTSSDPTFKVFTDGFAVRCKDWGKPDPFRQANPFSDINPYFPQKGGFGGENNQ